MMPGIKEAPRLVRSNGSHSLTVSRQYSSVPFEREELFPILELEVPRAGLVRASFEVSRYVASYSSDVEGGASEDRFVPWRVILRDVSRPHPGEPENVMMGAPASGVGDATRQAIREACEPIIGAYLESDDYEASRLRAAARAVVREIDAPRDYTIERVRTLLERVELAGDIEPRTQGKIAAALEQLERAGAMLEEVTA